MDGLDPPRTRVEGEQESMFFSSPRNVGVSLLGLAVEVKCTEGGMRGLVPLPCDIIFSFRVTRRAPLGNHSVEC